MSSTSPETQKLLNKHNFKNVAEANDVLAELMAMRRQLELLEQNYLRHTAEAAAAEAEPECPVCLSVIATDNLTITKCGHKYCNGCMDKMKQRNMNNCALCRRSL